jgi:hypothetical protein
MQGDICEFVDDFICRFRCFSCLSRDQPTMPLEPPPPFSNVDPFFSELAFLDMEASGLSPSSVPTEFGICGLDLMPMSFLIRPRSEWQEAEWSPMAEIMTGITQTLLAQEGVDPGQAGDMIEEALQGKVVVSDNPEDDDKWLIRLKPFWLHAGVRSIKEYETKLIYELSQSLGYETFDTLLRKTRKRYPHIHRAGPDALRTAATFRLLIDPAFRDFIANSP